MKKTLLNYRCDDAEGWYISSVEIIKVSDRQFIAHYLDFPSISSISNKRHHLDYRCPAMLRTLLAEETGYAPKIHLRDIEYVHDDAVYDKKTPRHF